MGGISRATAAVAQPRRSEKAEAGGGSASPFLAKGDEPAKHNHGDKQKDDESGSDRKGSNGGAPYRAGTGLPAAKEKG